LPTVRPEVVSVATPLDRGAWPKSVLVVVSRKSTLPVGVPEEPLARTVAVSVIA
jgi:hypothetical protein